MQLPRNKDEWPGIYREQYEERAGIMEYMGNMPRWQAEAMAEQVIRKMANNEQWESIT